VGFPREPAAASEVNIRADLLLARSPARKRVLIMDQNVIPKENYFLMGLGIGSLIGVLFAPKSGERTREYIAKKTREGNEHAHKKGQELRERAEDVVERSRKIVAQAGGRIATAIDVGIETYNREKMKSEVS
jgi:gas vesicle protein